MGDRTGTKWFRRSNISPTLIAGRVQADEIAGEAF
jgi:hypothetical protein